MVCNKCGKEMIKVGELTEKETEDFQYVVVREDNVYQALDTKTINGMDFDEGQVFEYFQAVFQAKAEMEFLKYSFFKKLKIRLGINLDEELWVNEDYTTGIVSAYKHP